MKSVTLLLLLGCAAVFGAAEPPALQLRLTADKTRLPQGPLDRPAVVTLTLAVKNTSQAAVVLRFNTGQRFDFVLYNSAGRPLKRWSEGRMFNMMTCNLTLAPGESKQFSGSLPLSVNNQSLVAGDYEVEAVLSSTPPQTAPRVKLQVVR